MRRLIDRFRRITAGGDDRGSLSVFVVIAAMALFLLVGLVVDGGTKLRADDVANEAARRGAQAIQVGAGVRGEGAQVDPRLAKAAAESYLAQIGMDGTVTVRGNTLTVDTSTANETVFLGLIGVGELTGHGHATATLTTEG